MCLTKKDLILLAKELIDLNNEEGLRVVEKFFRPKSISSNSISTDDIPGLVLKEVKATDRKKEFKISKWELYCSVKSVF